MAVKPELVYTKPYLKGMALYSSFQRNIVNQYYIVGNDVKLATKYLTEFASLMRTTMKYNQLQTNVLQQEIGYLNNYK